MASDIPDTYRSPFEMARALASYIADPFVVRSRVLDNFRTAPDTNQIRRMRAAHLRPPTPVEPTKPWDGYYPQDAAASLAATNSMFLLRLDQERTLSLAMRDYLKRPDEVAE